MLNKIWLSLFASGIITALYYFITGHHSYIEALSTALFDQAKLGFDIALGLTGLLCLWLGLFKVAEASGLLNTLARALSPLLHHLMPGVPKEHPAYGHITLNVAANMFGLDNAATPAGLKAMQSLQEVNPHKDIASNAQILFLVLNTSSLTILPLTIFLYRAQLGAANPSDVFIPILLATSASTLVGLFSVALVQRIPLFRPIPLLWLGGIVVTVTGLATMLSTMPPAQAATVSSMTGHVMLIAILSTFLFAGWRAKIDVYDTFIEGAKEGFSLAVQLIPYLVAMLVAIGVMRAGGALDIVVEGIRSLLLYFNGNKDIADALPTAFAKPFSGSAARAVMIETMETHGADSFAGRLSSIMQGSTETTFYVLAVYFGSVHIKRTRHAIPCALLADTAGIVAAIGIALVLF